MIEPRSNPTDRKLTFASDSVAGSHARSASTQSDIQEFLRGLLGPILVNGRPHFDPVGAIVLPEAATIWTWLERDIILDLSRKAAHALQQDGEPDTLAEFSRTIATAITEQLQLAQEDPELGRRTRVQIGDDVAHSHLKYVANGFRCHPYLAKAVAFGRALHQQREDQAISVSLNSFPARQSPLMPMLMHATIGQVANPARIVTVITQLAGGATERALTQSGFDTVLDALAAHAQHQLSLIQDEGRFADMDLACRAVARFHTLIRSMSIVGENDGHSRWAVQSAKLISHVSDQLGPRIKRIEADVRQSLRPSRSAGGAAETDMLLEALNGLYLLSTVREARDSLGVNSVLESAWTQTGQVLETLITRNLEAFKAEPGNELTARRLNAAINMARIRFNPEYADVIAKAMQGASRRPAPLDVHSANT